MNDDVAVAVLGVEVKLCCSGCKGRMAKSSQDGQVTALFGSEGFKKGFKPAAKEQANKEEKKES